MSPQTRSLPQAVPWTSQSTKLNPRVRYTSDEGARGCGAGTYLGIYKKKVTRSPRRAVPWTSQSTKWNPWALVPAIIGRGAGNTIDDSCITPSALITTRLRWGGGRDKARKSSSISFTHPSSNKDCYKYLFIPRTTAAEWNTFL